MMKSFLKLLSVGLLLFSLVQPSFAETPDYLMTQAKQQKITPERALEILKQGNQRFVDNTMRHYDYVDISKYSAAGQYPFAVVLNCIDSRSAPDFTFDQGLGNIFIARMAGNVIDKDVLGSMEFATKFAGAKLIAVVGHTYCGAIVGACKQVKAGNLTHLLSSIQPAVKMVQAKLGKKFSCDDDTTIDEITRQNVINQMKHIMAQSQILQELVQSKKVMLVGGMHSLVGREVVFFDLTGKKV